MKLLSERWQKFFIEAAVIVVSILLAFAIDAWWDERQQIQQDLVHLKAVHDELRQTRGLIEEATAAHQYSADVGADLLAKISAGNVSEDVAHTEELLRELMSFYQINAPVGALNTAIGSGVLSRMRNRELALSLANWPVALEDLLEEQNAGHDHLLKDFLQMLARKLPMADVLSEKVNITTVQGTRQVAPLENIEIRPSPFARDLSPLQEDYEIENQLLLHMVMARVAEGEALKFGEELDAVLATLDECIRNESC